MSDRIWRWHSDDVKPGDTVCISSSFRLDQGDEVVISDRDGPMLRTEDGRWLTIYQVLPT